MSATLSRFMNNARTKLPGATDPAIQYELFMAAEEFCEHSNIWQESIPFDVTPAGRTYEVIAAKGKILRLMSVSTQDGLPVTGVTMALPGDVTLKDTPQIDEELTAIVALGPVDPTTRSGDPEIPDWFFDRYHAAILDGVLGRMMSTLAKPYSSERHAIYHMRRFRVAMARARAEANRKNTYRSQAWRFPQSFATSR